MTNKFKKIISIILTVALTLTMTTIYFAATKTAKVTSFSGTVTIKRAGSEKTIKPFKNMSLAEGDTVTTDYDGEISVEINGKNVIKATKSSSYKISALSGKDDKTCFTLLYGTVYNDVKEKQPDDNSYKIETSNTIMGVRSTVFAVSSHVADGEEVTSVMTIEGSVNVKVLEDSDSGSGFVSKTNADAGDKISVSTTIASGDTAFVKENINYSNLNLSDTKWIIDNKELVSEDALRNAEENLTKASSKEKNVLDQVKTSLGKTNDSSNISSESPSTGGTETPPPIIPAPAGPAELISVTPNALNTRLTLKFDRQIATTSTLGVSIPATVVEDSIVLNISGIPAATVYTFTFNGVVTYGRTDTSVETPINYQKSYYNLYTSEDLKNLNLASIIPGIPAGDYILRRDIDFNNENWEAVSLEGIGTEFDGNSHEISNVRVIENSNVSNSLGFFSKIGADVEIKDLKLKGITVEPAITFDKPTGILAGIATGDAEIEDIEIEDSIINAPDVKYVGGAIGSIEIPETSFSIEDITVTNTEVTGRDSVAGIVGYLDMSNVSSVASLSFEDLVFKGDKDIISTDGSSGGLFGNITGRSGSDVKIEKSYVKTTKDIKGLNAGQFAHAGGIVGYIQDIDIVIQDSFVRVANINADDTAGGIIGNLNSGNTALIKDVYGVAIISTLNPANSGGLIGLNAGGSIATFDESFFIDVSNPVVLLGTGSGGTSVPVGASGMKTELVLKTAATYGAWDAGIWNITAGSYPELN